MGGRGSKSGMSVGNYTTFGSYEEAEASFGYGNGGLTDQWMASLTKSEENAIVKYGGGSFYYDFNQQLRDGGQIVYEWNENGDYVKRRVIDKSKQKVAKNLESALDKAVLDKPIQVSRASTGDLFGVPIGTSTTDTVKILNSKVGTVAVDKGFTSSTARSGHTPWQDGPYMNCVYHINVGPGKGIGAYIGGVMRTDYHRKDVTEFLFNRNSAFKLKGAYEKGGMVHVNMDYIGRNAGD